MNVPRLTALKRLAGADRAPPDYGLVSPAIALRLAISKAAQEVLKAPMAGGEVTESTRTLATLPDALPQRGLWVLLQGPGRARGVLTLDPSLLAAVLQARTTGKITGKTVAERLPTQTDAILTRRFLTVFLDALGERLAAHPAAAWLGQFQPRDRIAEAASLPHLLEDIAYRCLTLALDLGHGLRPGSLGLFVPEVEPEQPGAPKGAPGAMRDPGWEGALAAKVMSCPAELEAVLWRAELPLAEVSAWQPGSVLEIPAEALDSVTLMGSDGRPIGQGRLGQIRNRRAVRLKADGLAGAAVPKGLPEEDALALDAAAAEAAPAAGLPDLSGAEGDLPEFDLPAVGDGDLPEIGGDAPAEMDLPELPPMDDLPDLDLPDLDSDPLPDLDLDLPDLPDLPDLD